MPLEREDQKTNEGTKRRHAFDQPLFVDDEHLDPHGLERARDGRLLRERFRAALYQELALDRQEFRERLGRQVAPARL